MDAVRWERVQALFHDVADRSASEQHTLLVSATADDPSLVDDVKALLREDAEQNSIFERPLAVTAGKLLDERATPLPERRFGPYRVTGYLGEGGMGVVYRAVRDDIGAVVAIKLLRDATLSPARRERFAQEQRTLASLNHPGIATLHDADILDDGTPWFAMELVDGQPIVAYCNAHALTVRERLQLLRAVCEAVQHAHQHLIVHRDIKPANILVRSDGSVKLLDFGIAKPLESTDEANTRTGLRFMTPAYAAPEQFRGEAVGIHTDVYALGVVMYEMLTGQLPHDLSNATPSAAENIVSTHEPARPSQQAVARTASLSAGTSGLQWADLDVLCLTAMHRDSARRYRTIDALMRDIDHFLHDEPMDARADTVGYRVAKFVARHRAAVAWTSAAALLIVALSGVYAVRLSRARDVALAEVTRTQRVQRFLQSLFEGGDAYAGPADSLRVTTLIDRGVQEARGMVAEPAVRAELLETLGSVSTQLGQLARADTLLRESLAERKKLDGADNAAVAHTLISIAELRIADAQYDSAVVISQTALNMSKRHLPADHPQVAQATEALASALENQGKYKEAIATFTAAVGLRQNGGRASPELSANITGLANNYFYLGDYVAADSFSRKALAMSRKAFGDKHPHVAEDLVNVGAVQFELGKYDESERLYREALAINTRWYGGNHNVTASNLTMLGRSLRASTKYDEADSVLRVALRIQERVFGPVHPRVASALNDIASVALARKQYDVAAASYQRVCDIYRSVYNGRHWYIGIGIANLASVHMAQGDNARAEREFREALAMYATTLPPDHLNVGITTIKLGRTLLRQHRFAEAAKASVAGYNIVSKQTIPSIGWLQNARRDLVEVYDSLGTQALGERYRAELADSARTATNAASRKGN